MHILTQRFLDRMDKLLETDFIENENSDSKYLFHAAVFAEEAGYYGDEALNRAISKLSKYSNQEQENKDKTTFHQP